MQSYTVYGQCAFSSSIGLGECKSSIVFRRTLLQYVSLSTRESFKISRPITMSGFRSTWSRRWMKITEVLLISSLYLWLSWKLFSIREMKELTVTNCFIKDGFYHSTLSEIYTNSEEESSLQQEFAYLALQFDQGSSRLLFNRYRITNWRRYVKLSSHY